MVRFKTLGSVLSLALMICNFGVGPAWCQDQQPAPAETTAPAAATTPAEVAVAQAEPETQVNAATQEQTAKPEASAPETQKKPFDPFDFLVYKPLWTITRWIGGFNPIGKGISTPLENAIPGLRVKGFINNITQVNTTGNSSDAGLGGRLKDWRLQKEEERVQLELRYQANENIEFVSVENGYVDGAYALGHSSGLYNSGAGSQEYYTQGKRILREEYIRGNYGFFNFTLGKQIINWGKMDGKVTDIINASDERDVVDFHAGDYEWRAIGQWMANVSFRPTATTTINLVWNPDFQPDRNPAPGSAWWYPFAPSAPAGTLGLAEVRPSGLSRLSDSEEGVRVAQTIGALTLSGIYYYGFDRDYVYFTSDNKLHYTRLPKTGYALDYGTHIGKQRFIFRSEGLVTLGKAYQIGDPTLSNGIEKKNLGTLAVAVETSIFSDANRINIEYQPELVHQFGYDPRTAVAYPGTGAARNDITQVIDINHTIRKTADKLGLDATFYINAGGSVYGGWAANYAATWNFSDFVQAKLAYNDYQGGVADLPWGAYRRWRNVTLDVKYEF
jgi:hypothetical protein